MCFCGPYDCQNRQRYFPYTEPTDWSNENTGIVAEVRTVYLLRVKCTFCNDSGLRKVKAPKIIAFDPGPVHVGFVVDIVVLRQVFLQLRDVYLLSIIP